MLPSWRPPAFDRGGESGKSAYFRRREYRGFRIHHNVSDDFQQFIALWRGAEWRIEHNTIIRRRVNANEWGVFNITQNDSKNLVRNNIALRRTSPAIPSCYAARIPSRNPQGARVQDGYTGSSILKSLRAKRFTRFSPLGTSTHWRKRGAREGKREARRTVAAGSDLSGSELAAAGGRTSSGTGVPAFLGSAEYFDLTRSS
jgi:hypothetical protein